MDTNYFNQPAAPAPKLELTTDSLRFIDETFRWAKFLSILGFILVGLMVLFALFAGTLLSMIPNTSAFPFPTFLFSVFYFIIAAIYFFPVFYLFKFATNGQAALKETNSEQLALSLENLKSHYKFMGIFSIIILALYAIFFAFAILGALMR